MIELLVKLKGNAPETAIFKDGEPVKFSDLDSYDRYRIIQTLSDIEEEYMREHKTLW